MAGQEESHRKISGGFLVVLTQAAAGMRERFDDWYARHAQNVIKTPGLGRARRYALETGMELRAGEFGLDRLALYELTGHAEQVAVSLKQRQQSGDIRFDQSLDLSTATGFFVRPLTGAAPEVFSESPASVVLLQFTPRDTLHRDDGTFADHLSSLLAVGGIGSNGVYRLTGGKLRAEIPDSYYAILVLDHARAFDSAGLDAALSKIWKEADVSIHGGAFRPIGDIAHPQIAALQRTNPE